MTRSRAKWALLRFLLLTVACLGAAGVRPARADNLADESELEFELGAERYKAADFRGALEHFLASNRLVPNRNVVFNIARTYEQLKQSADAYRYFSQALEGETDEPTRARINEALTRTLPQIAVVRIESDPPGAMVYVGRRELGPRGNTPLVLGLTPGNYKIMGDLPGYESVELPAQDFVAGTKKEIKWVLKQIVGNLKVGGSPQGAAVRVDDEGGKVLCTLPCAADLPPGRHTLFASAQGYQSAAITATVVAGATAASHVDLTALTKTVLVTSDPTGALVTVDGKPQGFTPAALAATLGPHRVVVTKPGYRPFEQTLAVANEGEARVDADLTPVEEVTAASRVTESVEDAPSSVTIITGQELRAMGYPTIAEAVRGVRGVYVGDDTSYTNVGFRGFAQPGDYGDHVLILVDGMPTNDDYVGSSYVGYDARADIDDIQRIEVVRGPGSALYGTGAFFGVINLVTRPRDAPTHGEIATSTADNSVGRARATAQLRLSEDAGGWVSVAGAHGSGRDYFFNEYAADPATGGWARGIDGFDTGTVNGRIWYKALTLQWLYTSREKTLPSGEFGTIFGDPRSHFVDTRGLVELRFEPQVSSQLQWLTRAHANLYEFYDALPYTPENGGFTQEAFQGRWVGIEERLVYSPITDLRITAGGEYQTNFTGKQYGASATGPAYLDRDDAFATEAAYLVGDYAPSKLVKLSVGARYDNYDYSSNYDHSSKLQKLDSVSSINPRAAIIVRPLDRDIVKLMGGTAFRAPSVYEHFYEGPTQTAGGNLKSETVKSVELELTHRFTNTISGTVAGYTNYVENLIKLGGGGTETNPNKYFNTSNPIQTIGAEAEVRREWRNGVMLSASYSLQHSSYQNNDDHQLREVPNSPEHLAAIKGAAPLIGSALGVMTRVSVEGPRFDKYDQAGDPPQGTTPGAVLWDIVFSGEQPKYGLRYSLGLYNAMDYRHTVPVSREFTQTSIVQNGRTVMASTQVSF
jgi:outer membrane receptor protein involved in Fe transport